MTVLDSSGRFLAKGLYNGASRIRVRLYAWTDVELDEAFWRARLTEALGLRDRLGLMGEGTACRMVFSEGDALGGLTVDRYDRWLAVKLTSLAMAQRQSTLLDILEELITPAGIVLRTERGVRETEGLELQDGWVRGEPPKGACLVSEGPVKFEADLAAGQKTGFYLDQRRNRERVARYAAGRSVADVCCYSGGFAITALAGGAASAVGIDVSAPALALATRNAVLNGVSDRAGFERGDAFQWLESQALRGNRFQLIVLDPPSFARSRRGVPEALRAYTRLNALALRCLDSEGILMTHCCSGRVAVDDFVVALRDAAAQSGVHVRILERHGQPPDHPASATCPETAYLKTLIAAVG